MQSVGISVSAGIFTGFVGWWSRTTGLVRRWVEVAGRQATLSGSAALEVKPATRGVWAVFSGTVGAIVAATLLFGRPEPLWMVPFFVVWACGLAVLALIDRETLFLPTKLLRLCALLAVGTLVVQAITSRYWGYLGRSALCAAMACAVFAAWSFWRPGGLGFGDVRLATLVAFGAGAIWPVGCLVALVCAPLGAAAVSAFRHRVKGTGQNEPVALGPFLARAGIVAVVARAI